jgi:hypothetical protein
MPFCCLCPLLFAAFLSDFATACEQVAAEIEQSSGMAISVYKPGPSHALLFLWLSIQSLHKQHTSLAYNAMDPATLSVARLACAGTLL